MTLVKMSFKQKVLLIMGQIREIHQSHVDEVSIVIDQDLKNPSTGTSLASLDVIKNDNK